MRPESQCQTIGYYCSFERPPLETGVCGDEAVWSKVALRAVSELLSVILTGRLLSPARPKTLSVSLDAKQSAKSRRREDLELRVHLSAHRGSAAGTEPLHTFHSYGFLILMAENEDGC
ncbi:unnamed protein product [Pleuronectes platessa]|uniref:Uncharacterized protein n=1 Tax=Pleuronectes platessa TaxID=8262 RepID=A0A9N7TUN2_PLEPL|nr:unnamed protein product [Pleuronectes platessa]